MVEGIERKETVPGRKTEELRPPHEKPLRLWKESPSLSSSSRELSTVRRASWSRRGPGPTVQGSGGCRSDGHVFAFLRDYVRVGLHVRLESNRCYGVFGHVLSDTHSPSCVPPRNVVRWACTTVTFDEKDGNPLLVSTSSIPLGRLDAAGRGADAMGETFEQRRALGPWARSVGRPGSRPLAVGPPALHYAKRTRRVGGLTLVPCPDYI